VLGSQVGKDQDSHWTLRSAAANRKHDYYHYQNPKKKKREYKEIEIGPLFLVNVRRLAMLLPFMMTAGPEIT
jgi:hypothetical protein